MIRAVRSLADGLWMVFRAPILVAGIVIVTMTAALPFGAVLGSRLQEALANQPPIELGSGEIDADWWVEFRAHAEGLAATFTPTVIGFAAPLDNLSAILDGGRRPLALAGPVILTGVMWAWLWGAILHRFSIGRSLPLREFVSAGSAHFPGFVMVSVAAALAQLALYLTVHAALFGPVYAALAANTDSERTAFFIRVGLYVMFGTLLVLVSLTADYTRVGLVVTGPSTLRVACATGVGFVRRHLGTVLVLYVMTGALFVRLLVLYGTAEIYGGSRIGGWRGVLVAQAYIVARLVIRLTFAASETQLFKSLRAHPS
jgi:hypothetical protein